MSISQTRRWGRLTASSGVAAAAVALGMLAAPVHAATTSLDASITITGGEDARPGGTHGFTFAVRSTVPTASYRMRVQAPAGFTRWEWDVNNGWECRPIADNDLDCTYTRAPSTAPLDMNIAWVLPEQPGTFQLAAALYTAEADVNPANNRATRTVTTTPATGRIAGRLWNDSDADGRRDAGERGVAGTAVVLLRYHADSLAVAASTTTDRSGAYSFPKLQPSDPAENGYIVLAAAPGARWTFSKKDVGSDYGDSDLTEYVKSDHDAGYDSYFPKGTRIGYSDPLQVKSHGTTVIDGGSYLGAKPGA